jgi:hypothetical protein
MIWSFILTLWAKVKVPFLFGLAIAGAALMALRQARRDGVNQVLVEQQEKRDELQQHYNEIDAGPIDPPASYDRLRDRAKGGKH